MILSVQGLVPASLGLKTGWIRSAAGGRVAAEVLISHVMGEDGERPLPGGLLIAGGAECGQYLLADPRVQLLVQQMLAAARPVGWLRPVSFPLLDLLEKRSVGFPFLLQESQTAVDFVNLFVQRLYESWQDKGIVWEALLR